MGHTMQNETMIMGNAVIGDLEIEITGMDKEISYLTKELARAERFKAEHEKLSELWRAHLDEAAIEDDSPQEKEARQILWNDSDSAQVAEAEWDAYEQQNARQILNESIHE